MRKFHFGKTSGAIIMLMLFSMSVFYNPAFAKEKGGSKITTVKNSVKNSVSSLNVSTPIIPTVDVIAPIYGNTFAARPGEKGIDAYQFLLQANKLPVRVSSITLSAYYDHNGDGIYGTKYGQETVNGKTYYLKDVVKNIYIEDFRQTERYIEMMKETIEENKKTIEESKKTIEEKVKLIEDNNKLIEDKDKLIEDKDKLIEELKKQLKSNT